MHSIILEKHDQLIAACKQFGVARLDVFGSAARGDDFNPATSDVDFLVAFPSGVSPISDYDLRDTLARILDRRVDLVDRKAIENSRNYIRRRHILSETELVYVA